MERPTQVGSLALVAFAILGIAWLVYARSGALLLLMSVVALGALSAPGSRTHPRLV